jgi:hypothetical protein
VEKIFLFKLLIQKGLPGAKAGRIDEWAFINPVCKPQRTDAVSAVRRPL